MNKIQLSTLGTNGRFGNQMFQFAVAKKFSQEQNCVLEIPAEWIGRKLWDIVESAIQMPILPRGKPEELKINTDIYGYFQFQSAISKLSKSELQKWYSFKQEWVDRFPKIKPYYIAAHVRKGDYISAYSHIYCNISEKSYLNACTKHGLDSSQLVFIREDAPQIDPELDALGLGFLPDFMTLVNADVILRANSTFSWWASVLGNGNTFSPLVEDRVGAHDVEFVKGNWPRMVDAKACGGNVSDLHLPD